ncbi:unnamed protein product [Allacma fusca]|uniref:Uncharacterized protein n=1 Tax=Allacma fusca TaxID=39272 RepID=A0A8J2L5D5_9HEXA|nr:unnamed protein product [Allacma fusca]
MIFVIQRRSRVMCVGKLLSPRYWILNVDNSHIRKAHHLYFQEGVLQILIAALSADDLVSKDYLYSLPSKPR